MVVPSINKRCNTLKKERKLSLWMRAVFLVFGLLILSSIFAQEKQAHAASPAFVRIIHASPFVGTADVFLDGNPLLTSFAFGAVTDYAEVPPGPHKVQIALTGKGIGASALTETLAVQPGGVYTVAAIGTSAQNLSLLVFNDSNLVVSGTAKVRVYDLAPDAGAVNVFSQGRSLWDGSYQQASEYLALATGTAAFAVNTSAYNQGLSVMPLLKANTVTSIFAIGLFNGAPKAQLVQSQVAAVPELPNTGSNPFAFISDGSLTTPWLLIALATLCVGCTFLTRRWFRAR